MCERNRSLPSGFSVVIVTGRDVVFVAVWDEGPKISIVSYLEFKKNNKVFQSIDNSSLKNEKWDQTIYKCVLQLAI